jgi:hypothetical protein
LGSVKAWHPKQTAMAAYRSIKMSVVGAALGNHDPFLVGSWLHRKFKPMEMNTTNIVQVSAVRSFEKDQQNKMHT